MALFLSVRGRRSRDRDLRPRSACDWTNPTVGSSHTKEDPSWRRRKRPRRKPSP